MIRVHAANHSLEWNWETIYPTRRKEGVLKSAIAHCMKEKQSSPGMVAINIRIRTLYGNQVIASPQTQNILETF